MYQFLMTFYIILWSILPSQMVPDQILKDH